MQLTESRRFTSVEEKFIAGEMKQMLSDEIIELSSLPWRAQVHIINDDDDACHRKRLAVNTSMKINHLTLLDTYPAPKIEDQARKLARYKS